jgi:type IX secretion system PorP/SprF family membrane protein
MMKKISLFLLALGSFYLLRSQDLPVYNQYFSEHDILNPAYAGMKNCIALSMADNHQWLGLKAAPNTQYFFVRGRVSFPRAKNYNGVGLILSRDQNGAFRNMDARLIYAYHLLLSDAGETMLSMGFSAGTQQISVNEHDFYNYNNDPVITGNRISVWNPELSIGIAAYNKVFYSGISASNLLPAFSYVTDPQPADQNQRLYIAHAGIIIPFRGKDIEFEPSLAFHLKEMAYNRLDINLKAYYRQMIWLGLSVRQFFSRGAGAVSGLLPAVGIQFKRFEIAYSYGLGFSSIYNNNYGTHHLLIRWKTCHESKGAIPCPAYN